MKFLCKIIGHKTVKDFVDIAEDSTCVRCGKIIPGMKWRIPSVKMPKCKPYQPIGDKIIPLLNELKEDTDKMFNHLLNQQNVQLKKVLDYVDSKETFFTDALEQNPTDPTYGAIVVEYKNFSKYLEGIK